MLESWQAYEMKQCCKGGTCPICNEQPTIKDDKMTLIDKIEELMQSDEADREKESAYLIDRYQYVDSATKKHIDLCFISLCGYGLGSLIKEDKDG